METIITILIISAIVTLWVVENKRTKKFIEETNRMNKRLDEYITEGVTE